MLNNLILFYFAFEGVEPHVPELGEELLEIGEPLGTCPVQTPRAVASLAHEPRLLEDVQMLGDRRASHVEVARDLAGAELVVSNELQNLAAPGSSDRFQGGFHGVYVSILLRKKQLTNRFRSRSPVSKPERASGAPGGGPAAAG